MIIPVRCFTCNKVRVGVWAGVQHCSRALLSLRPVSPCSSRLPQLLRVVHTTTRAGERGAAAARNAATPIAAHRGVEPGAFARASRRQNAGAASRASGAAQALLATGLGERDRVVKARADHACAVAADRGAHVQALSGNG